MICPTRSYLKFIAIILLLYQDNAQRFALPALGWWERIKLSANPKPTTRQVHAVLAALYRDVDFFSIAIVKRTDICPTFFVVLDEGVFKRVGVVVSIRTMLNDGVSGWVGDCGGFVRLIIV